MAYDFGLEEDYTQYSDTVEPWSYEPDLYDPWQSQEDTWSAGQEPDIGGGAFWEDIADPQDDFWAAEEEYYLEQPEEDFKPFWEEREDEWSNQYDLMFAEESGGEDTMWGGIKTAAGKVGDAALDFFKTPGGVGLARSALGVLGEYLFGEDKKEYDLGPIPSGGGGGSGGRYIPRPGSADLTKSQLAAFMKKG